MRLLFQSHASALPPRGRERIVLSSFRQAYRRPDTASRRSPLNHLRHIVEVSRLISKSNVLTFRFCELQRHTFIHRTCVYFGDQVLYTARIVGGYHCIVISCGAPFICACKSKDKNERATAPVEKVIPGCVLRADLGNETRYAAIRKMRIKCRDAGRSFRFAEIDRFGQSGPARRASSASKRKDHDAIHHARWAR